MYYLRTTHNALGEYRFPGLPKVPVAGPGVHALHATEYRAFEDVVYECQLWRHSFPEQPMPTREQIQADLDAMVAAGLVTAFEDMDIHKPDCPCRYCDDMRWYRQHNDDWDADKRAEERNEQWLAFDQYWRPSDMNDRD